MPHCQARIPVGRVGESVRPAVAWPRARHERGRACTYLSGSRRYKRPLVARGVSSKRSPQHRPSAPRSLQEDSLMAPPTPPRRARNRGIQQDTDGTTTPSETPQHRPQHSTRHWHHLGGLTAGQLAVLKRRSVEKRPGSGQIARQGGHRAAFCSIPSNYRAVPAACI